MDFIRLTDPADPRLEDAFALYEISFPLHERRTRPAQAARLSHPEYRYTLLYEGDQFQGILLYWEGPGFRYVEHFAIARELRGRGIGAQALEQLSGQGIPVILEIDPPVDSVSIRRQHFYERCGFAMNSYPTSTPLTAKDFKDTRWWYCLLPSPCPGRPTAGSPGTWRIPSCLTAYRRWKSSSSE